MDKYYVKQKDGIFILMKSRRFIDKEIERFTYEECAQTACFLMNGGFAQTQPRFYVAHDANCFVVYHAYSSKIDLPVKEFIYVNDEEREYAYNLATELAEKLNEKNLLSLQ